MKVSFNPFSISFFIFFQIHGFFVLLIVFVALSCHSIGGILAFKLIMENPKRYGYRLHANQLYQPVAYTTVTVTGSVDSWVTWAKQKGITYAQLREANPWIRSTKLTNKSGKTYSVRVPQQNELYRSKRKFTAYNPAWVVK